MRYGGAIFHVSGGLFRQQKVIKVQVTAAIIFGISTGFLEEGGYIHFNFAFDEDVFKIADSQLRTP